MNEAHEFLRSTELCNSDHPEIRRRSAEIVGDLDTDREKAAALFLFVRDRVRYRLGLYRHSASETLELRSGSCSTKANLLVALLRAAGIPAGFHLMKVKTKEYFGPLCTPQFHPYLSERSLHVYCAVSLGGRWVQCDPSDDAALSEATAHINPQSRKVEFDGSRDARLRIEARHIVVDDPERYPDIDGILSKACRKPQLFLQVLDGYLDFMRQRGSRYTCAESLSRDFLRSLEKDSPEGYALFTSNRVSAS